MRSEDFVHLHFHSTYSLLEALPSPEEIVLRAHELGQSAVALTDKGYTYGLMEFYQAAHKYNLKPVLGMEVYVAARTRLDLDPTIDAALSPLILIAESQDGYQNLLKLATFASLEGLYGKPRVDDELLKTYGNGLIALSGSIEGLIPQAALAEDGDRITALAEKYQSFFGKNNVYFELIDLPNVTGQAEINQQLITWSKALDIPLVVTCASHYCRPEDAEAHDVLLCIQKNALVNDPNRFSMQGCDFSMRPFSELERVFGHVPDALKNSRAIADRCQISFKNTGYHIPRFTVPLHESEDSELRRLAEIGLMQRYGEHTSDLHRARLEHELQIIKQMGFSGYFLIVADFVNEAKRRGITVGPGRGSAAGSLVSYSLNITALDPLEHGLIFERFLNPERIDMPDIDMDFADTRRDEVLEYVREKYGKDHVVQICTFGTLAARAAVKDVGRAYGVSFLEMNALAKLIPDRPGTRLCDALKTDELHTAYTGNETYRRIFDAALKLEGKNRHVSIHACGVIITPEPAVTFTALQRAPKDDQTIITQFAAKSLHALGLLKMDFLGLTNLTVIQTTLEIIKRTCDKEVDIRRIPPSDRKAFDLLKRGETTGVFQFESAGMRRYLRQLKPSTFQDITAMAALYRPGPMEWIPDYIKRKHGQEKVVYLHPDLKDILQETYGIGVYQEQILKLAQTFAGFSLGEADLLRRAIGKKIKEELHAQREKFIQGAISLHHPQPLAEKIFDDVVLPFAGYGFPKSHAVCYARIAFETAYLKAHYPVEFMAALLSSDASRTDRILVEIEECRAMGINVLPPDINQSLRHFTARPPEKAIRFGLSAIKGIGDTSVRTIIDERERAGVFTSLEDLARRLPAKLLNKKLIEALAKSGALDSFGERRRLLEHYTKIIDFKKACGDSQQGQGDLFATTSESFAKATIEFASTVPASPQQRLQWEKECLGLYVSSHPLMGLKKYIGKKAQLIEQFSVKDAGRKITVAGLVETIRRIQTKKGETMGVILLEDPTGKIEVTLFPKVFASAQNFLEQPDTVLVIGGSLNVRAGALQVRADAVKRASLSTMIAHAKAEGFFDESASSFPSRSNSIIPTEETVELVDEEGNVIAGERMTVFKEENTFLGPLAAWIKEGMPTHDLIPVSSPALQISIHTIALPERAPKQLLIELKHTFEKFPGKERVQLKIGETIIPVSLTISMSTILEKKIEEVVGKYLVSSE
ncbi:DNA polymerase III subunit alpha [Candidatus Peregrinibacteria bacterium]|nr:DNA polymerase III subunit alpha [Candidatus Peregrinibacteria bacterium]